MEILYYILTFIFGFILGGTFGAGIMWVYGQITDKVQLVKTGYGVGKGLLIYLINKLK
jgi:hypothetical protein